MRRRLLIISKEPEFDSGGEVILGQCEPFTSGWSLTMIDVDGRRENLIVGTYLDLRKIQDSCSHLDDPASVRKRVHDLRILMVSNVGDTFVVGDESSKGGSTKELPAVSQTPMPSQTPGGLLSLQPSGSVLVATVAQPERADDSDYLRDELLALLHCKPKAVVMDLARVPNLSDVSVMELAGVSDQLRESGTGFALFNVTQSAQLKLSSMMRSEKVRIFENKESALAALKS